MLSGENQAKRKLADFVALDANPLDDIGICGAFTASSRTESTVIGGGFCPADVEPFSHLVIPALPLSPMMTEAGKSRRLLASRTPIAIMKSGN
jgi:hypothetical protein